MSDSFFAPRPVLALAISAGLMGCGTITLSTPAPPSLAGTNWELVAIQSMDDGQGTIRPPAPDQFMVSFGDDGRASFRLDCNRGTAAWKLTPSPGAAAGQLSFGPIAATRAMCPPPHFDERVVRDMAYVRSYLLKDGKLFMSLMADGGIYEWRPVQH